MACETFVNTGLVVISGQISTETYVDDQKTAAYGHFGRDDHDFTWERTDKADLLRAEAGLDAAVAT